MEAAWRCATLGAQQVGQHLHDSAIALQARGYRLVERCNHALQAQPLQGADHLMPLHARPRSVS
jgi:hypothetical protein